MLYRTAGQFKTSYAATTHCSRSGRIAWLLGFILWSPSSSFR